MNLKQFRERTGITQQKLADDTGIDRALIARYENGSRKPPLDNLILLAKYFDVSTDDLIGLESSAPQLEYESLMRLPGMKILFDSAKNATEDDRIKAAHIIEVLKGENRGN